MELPAGSTVSLLTADSDFYSDNRKDSVAPALIEQAAAAEIRVEAYVDCGALLTAKKPNQPVVDQEAVRAAIERLIPAEVQRVLNASGVLALTGSVITAVPQVKLSLFLTERPDLPAVIVRMQVQVRKGNGDLATVSLSGRAAFDQTSKDAQDLRITEISGAFGSLSTSGSGLFSEPPSTRSPDLLLPLEKVMSWFER